MEFNNFSGLWLRSTPAAVLLIVHNDYKKSAGLLQPFRGGIIAYRRRLLHTVGLVSGLALLLYTNLIST